MRRYLTKALALVLTLAMVLSVTPISFVSAASPTDIRFKIGTVTVTKGSTDEIVVPVTVNKIPENFQLSATGWEFLFDQNSIQFQVDPEHKYATYAGQLIKKPDKDMVMGKVASNDGTNGKFRFGFATTENYITPADVAATDGTILYLKFKLADGLAAGTYPITVQSYGNIANGVEEYVNEDDIIADYDTYMIPGAIVVEEPAADPDFIVKADEVEVEVGATTVDVPVRITKMYADKLIGGITVEVNYDVDKFTFDEANYTNGSMVVVPADVILNVMTPGLIRIMFTSATDPISAAMVAADNVLGTVKLGIKDSSAPFESVLNLTTNDDLYDDMANTLIAMDDMGASLKAGKVTVKNPTADPTLESIAVSDAKTEYTVGDAFVAPTVTATYSDQSTKTVQATFSGYDMATAGTQTVTVTFEGVTTTYDITVAGIIVPEKNLVSIAVGAFKAEYEVGDEFVKPVITATYDDESTADVTAEATFSGFDSTTVGTKTITVTYEGKTATFDVEVVGAVVKVATSIEILDAKTSYYKGDLYKEGDVVILVTYEDGSTDEIDVTEEMLTGFKTSTIGPKVITVTYRENDGDEAVTTTYTINVVGQGSSGSSGSSGSTGNGKHTLLIIDDDSAVEKDVLKFNIGSTKYTLNEKAYYTDSAFYLKNDRTFVPIRFIAETLGFKVTWDEATETVTMTDGKTTIVLTIGSTTMYIDGKAKIMDVAPELTDDRTFVPVRFVAEGFGGVVGWEDATQMVTITIEK